MTDVDRTDAEILSFRIDIPQADLDDLADRLARTRWTDEIEGAGWDYGTSLGYLKGLTDYWRDGFDWRKQEAELNRSAQFWAEIGGFRIHFVHERGKGPHPVSAGTRPTPSTWSCLRCRGSAFRTARGSAAGVRSGTRRCSIR
ncbi:MAG: epoxide hydrolase [Rubrobacteraceae bacterium]|nr:epoxide hydrolase [Rubrobacteraceae bacterium]